MSIANRIKQARKVKKLSQVELASRIGVSQSAVGNYESGVSSPKEPILFRLMAVLDVDANFLYQDEMRDASATMHIDEYLWAQPLNDAYRASLESTQRSVCKLLDCPHIVPGKTAKGKVVPFVPKRTIKMQVFDHPAAAGIPIYAESDFEFLEFEEDEIPTGADFGIRIAGNSMEPTIEDGSIVWIHRQPDIHNGNIGVFMLEGGDAVCKRARCASDGRLVALESDNEKYKPIKGEALNEIRLVGRVLI